MFRSTSANRVAGFTLIEVLVALAVLASSLAAIGSVVAITTKNVRSLEQRVAFTQSMRAIMAGLPDRRDLKAGMALGETAGYRWRIEVTPFLANFVDPGIATPWVPQSVVIKVQSPDGRIQQVDTVRLRRREGG